MIMNSLALRIREFLLSRLYMVHQENKQLRKQLEDSRKQEALLQNMVSETYQQGAEIIKSLTKKLAEADQQRLIQNEKMSELQGLASRDSLTNLLNRHGFKKALHRQVSTIQRYTHDNDSPFHSPYMILLDLDKFKEVNDTYGHQKGDEVLLVVTEILNEVFHRDTDLICRPGGDEFHILLLNSTEGQVIARAELLRKKIEGEKRLHFPGYSVTGSIGVTMTNIMQDTKASEMDDICKVADASADQAMYHSKGAGRNIVTMAIGNTLRVL